MRPLENGMEHTESKRKTFKNYLNELYFIGYEIFCIFNEYLYEEDKR